MTSKLKTVLVDALNDQDDGSGMEYVWHDPQTGLVILDGKFDLDRLASTITNHFLDRVRVRVALDNALNHPVLPGCEGGFDLIVDRLIEGLAGGSE